MLAWDSDLTSVTGFAVTVDGVRTDYGMTPVPPGGTCGCAISAASLVNATHTIVVGSYDSSGESDAPPFVTGPTANAGGPYSGQAGSPLSVSGAASTDQSGTISTYVWNWGDGTAPTSSSSATASHVYAGGGTFTITLNVTDVNGATSSGAASASIAAAILSPPGTPTSPSPASGATGTPTSVTLTWSASGATGYTIDFGTTNPPPQVAANLTAASYTPPTLGNTTTYYWQVIAINSGGSKAGPVWSFTTAQSAPSAPANPTPTDGATGVSTSPTLSWRAAGATSYTVNVGTANPPPLVASGLTTASYPLSALNGSTRYYWQIDATNSTGTTTGPVWSFTTSATSTTPTDVVLYAGDAASTAIHGMWSLTPDATAAGGSKLATPNTGWSSASAPKATPANYVDVTFNADAGVPYAIWMRLEALNNSKYNDSLWVQFSDALANGSPVYQIGTTNGLVVNLATSGSGKSITQWGWQNGAYWITQATTITFATTGTHTIRVQVREDGVEFDQIVLSPQRYLTKSPGTVTNDSTIVPKP